MAMDEELAEIFRRAKELDLLDWADRHLGKGHPVGNGWTRYSACPSCGEGSASSVRCSVGQDGFWRCYACGLDGDIIDAQSLLTGTSKVKAARDLLRGASIPVRTQRSKEERIKKEEVTSQALQQVLCRMREMLQSSSLSSEVVEYLHKQRGLSLSIIAKAHQRGLIGNMPTKPHQCVNWLEIAFGRPMLEKAGLWNPDKKWPKIAGRPLVSFMPGDSSAEFRVITPPPEGVSKSIRFGNATRPYLWKGSKPGSKAITEGWIDMLSLAELGFDRDIEAIPGVNQWQDDWATHDVYIVAVDNDEGGRKHGPKIVERIIAMGKKAVLKLPTHEGDDINDALRRKLGLLL